MWKRSCSIVDQLVFLAAQGLHGLQGLQAFLAAQGLHGLQAFLAAQGLHAPHGFLAAQGLPAPQGFFAAQGLHGLQGLVAQAAVSLGTTHFWETAALAAPQGLHGLQGLQGLHAPQGFLAAHGLHGLHAASSMISGLGCALGKAAGFSAAGLLARAPQTIKVPPTMAIPAPNTVGITVVESKRSLNDFTRCLLL